MPRAFGLPDDMAGYQAALAEAKAAIQAARTRAVLAVNAELIGLYWQLGGVIVEREADQGWGAKVVERFSTDCGRRSRR